MKISEIVTGTKLELEIFDSVGEKINNIFVSQFEWSHEEDSAIIAAPIFEGSVYPIRLGTQVFIHFYDKIDLYKFSAEVIDRSVIDNIALLKIKIKGTIIKIQRRQFFRFDFSLPVNIRALDSFKPDLNSKLPFIKTITKDLSGGGISVYAMDRIEMHTIVEVELEVLENKIVKFLGKIVRVTKLPSVEKFNFDLGVSFRKIEDRDKEAIIKRIFMEQRKLRKKGLI